MFADSPAARVLVALDTADREAAQRQADRLIPHVGGLKLGKQFFTANGPQGVAEVARRGPDDDPGAAPRLFLDLKFHDIPNTVAGAIRAAAPLRPDLINVHASGGRAMMQAAARAAREAAAEQGGARPRVLAVTVLTSLDDDDLAAVGQTGPVGDQVRRLGALAVESGLDGLVCSPRELKLLRGKLGPEVLLVVPGVRPAWAEAGDQKRITTPAEALGDGADALVVGRPITGADDPVAAAQRIVQDVAVAKIAWG